MTVRKGTDAPDGELMAAAEPAMYVHLDDRSPCDTRSCSRRHVFSEAFEARVRARVEQLKAYYRQFQAEVEVPTPLWWRKRRWEFDFEHGIAGFTSELGDGRWMWAVARRTGKCLSGVEVDEHAAGDAIEDAARELGSNV